MPWYIHLYHTAWAVLMAGVAYWFGIAAGLAVLALIVLVSILINT